MSRNVSHLFAKSRVVKRQDWMFPILQNSCVQLELNGTLEGEPQSAEYVTSV